MKPIYVYFSFRHIKKVDRMIASVAMYLDPEGTKLLNVRVTELNPWDNNNYVKTIQSYANVLNVLYEKQAMLDAYGFDQVVLMTDNKVLHGWIANGSSHGHAEWFKRANRPFRVGGEKEITVTVGLGMLASGNPAYKFCKPEYVDHSVVITKRGVHIISEEEEKAEAKEDEPELFSVQDILVGDATPSVAIEGIG